MRVIFWGASGHAKVLKEYLSYIPQYQLVALFDNNPYQSAPYVGVPVYIGERGFRHWISSKDREDIWFLIAIGGDKGKDRVGIHNFLTKENLKPLTIIHPTAFVAHNTNISASCQVLAGASVCVEASLGIQTIVNTNASVDHECQIGKGVHIAPGATLGGCVEVGDFSMIAIGTTVLPNIKIGTNSIVGAGSVVTKDIPDNVIAYGNPARVIRSRNTVFECQCGHAHRYKGGYCGKCNCMVYRPV